MKNKTKIIAVLVVIGLGFWVGITNTRSELGDFSRRHPIVTTIAGAIVLYAGAYAAVHAGAKTKNVQVKLIDSGNTDLAHNKHEQYLFVHGIAETHTQADWYTKDKSSLPYLMDGRVFTYDFPDATTHFWRVNFTQTGLGQHNEVMGLKSAYDQTIERLKAEGGNQDLVLVGVSRGATAILNFMGLYHPAHIKALVLESPFDSTFSIAQNIAHKGCLRNVPGSPSMVHNLMSFIFWNHCTDGLRAIDAAPSIDKDLPILLVSSQQDARVPCESTQALYDALRDSGHSHVHMLVLEQGLHGRILQGASGSEYQAAVNAFYKKYGIAYDDALAFVGQDLLK